MHTPSESATRTHNAVVKDLSLSVRDATIKALPHTSVKPTASEGSVRQFPAGSSAGVPAETFRAMRTTTPQALISLNSRTMWQHR